MLDCPPLVMFKKVDLGHSINTTDSVPEPSGHQAIAAEWNAPIATDKGRLMPRYLYCEGLLDQDIFVGAKWTSVSCLCKVLPGKGSWPVPVACHVAYLTDDEVTLAAAHHAAEMSIVAYKVCRG